MRQHIQMEPENPEFIKVWLNRFRDYPGEIETISKAVLEYERLSIPCDDLKKQLGSMTEDYMLLKDIIRNIKNVQIQSIYRFRYILGYTWTAIAAELFMSNRNVKYIHDDALPDVRRLYRIFRKQKEDLEERSCNYCGLDLRDWRKTVVLDFDGVIHGGVGGWICDSVIPAPPAPGIMEAIANIRKDYRVVVVSGRCSTEEGKEAIEAWLSRHGISVDDVTVEKPPAFCHIDEKTIRFDRRADLSKEKIAAFQPWYHTENIASWFLLEAEEQQDGAKTYVCSACGIYLETFDADLPGECPHCHMKMKGEES